MTAGKGRGGSIDPDVDIDDPAQKSDVGRRELSVVAAIAVGGIVGAEARYGLGEALPHTPGAWPWSTLLINVIGSALIGVLMVVVLEASTPHHLVRPFLGVGVLGGFTTFSTFSVDFQNLLLAHRVGVAAGYVLTSLAACLVVTATAMRLTRAATVTRMAQDRAAQDRAVQNRAAQ